MRGGAHIRGCMLVAPAGFLLDLQLQQPSSIQCFRCPAGSEIVILYYMYLSILSPLSPPP